MGVPADEIAPADVGVSFEMLRGHAEHSRGVRIRTMVRGRGEIRPTDRGSEVRVRFRPHWEAVSWMAFTSLLALVGSAALLISLVTGQGPLLSPVAAMMLFGAMTALRLRDLRTARRGMESDLLTWLTH